MKAPTLVAWGEKDRLLPMDRHAERFRTEIPGGQFRVLRGLGHTPMWDDPAQIAELIADFATRRLGGGERSGRFGDRGPVGPGSAG